MSNKKIRKEYFIKVKELDIKIKVAQRTYYNFINQEPGEIESDKKQETYIVDLKTIKTHTRLFNMIRRL